MWIVLMVAMAAGCSHGKAAVRRTAPKTTTTTTEPGRVLPSLPSIIPADATADRALLTGDGRVLVDLHRLAAEIAASGGACPVGVVDRAKTFGPPVEVLAVAGDIHDQTTASASAAEVMAVRKVVSTCATGRRPGDQEFATLADARALVEVRFTEIGIR